jgi:hypothetical protein
MADDDLLGVSALAAKLGISKGTVSKQANAGKIPIAERDAKGNPLFSLADVERAREDNLNPLMRRTEEPAPAADDQPAESPQRAPSELQLAAINEKQLKGRKLLGDLAAREGLTVLKSIVELEQTTIARRTRDSVTNGMAEKASAAYSFAGTPRTEAEWRVWLTERTREAFNTFEATLALETDDEFDDEHSVVAGDAVAEGGS